MNTAMAGVNVAVVWGFFLIILAFVMALVYGRLCDQPMADNKSGDSK
jgi:uncharacterized membrane protein (DUF485 family)